LARAISSGRVETPRDGETAINIGFSATNPIGKKSCGTWIGTFAAAGCKETNVDNTGWYSVYPSGAAPDANRTARLPPAPG
jgi:hypothetical protein